MDFFSGKNPDLIGPTMRTTLNDIINKPKISNSTISEKIMGTLSTIYTDYIHDNLFIIFIIIIMAICLVYRYKNKKNNGDDDDNKEDFVPNKCSKREKDVDLIEQIKNYNFEYEDIPRAWSPPSGDIRMNPLEGIGEKQTYQTDKVYPPDTMPVNVAGDKVFVRNLYGTPIGDQPLNFPDYDYDNVYKSKSRSYYAGAYNTYQNAQDTSIENPYSWSNKFNTTTGNFVGGMTNLNLQSITDYQTIIDNTESNLRDGINGKNGIIPEFEKPYEE
jgi:hypothetical protein